jgi:hypothetical protein
MENITNEDIVALLDWIKNRMEIGKAYPMTEKREKALEILLTEQSLPELIRSDDGTSLIKTNIDLNFLLTPPAKQNRFMIKIVGDTSYLKPKQADNVEIKEPQPAKAILEKKKPVEPVKKVEIKAPAKKPATQMQTAINF